MSSLTTLANAALTSGPETPSCPQKTSSGACGSNHPDKHNHKHHCFLQMGPKLEEEGGGLGGEAWIQTAGGKWVKLAFLIVPVSFSWKTAYISLTYFLLGIWSWVTSACNGLEWCLSSQRLKLSGGGERTRSQPLDQWSVTRALALWFCRKEFP